MALSLPEEGFEDFQIVYLCAIKDSGTFFVTGTKPFSTTQLGISILGVAHVAIQVSTDQKIIIQADQCRDGQEMILLSLFYLYSEVTIVYEYTKVNATTLLELLF